VRATDIAQSILIAAGRRRDQFEHELGMSVLVMTRRSSITKKKLIEILTSQALDDLEAKRFDTESALRAIAAAAWDTAQSEATHPDEAECPPAPEQ
jgi:hypothetical protein